MVEEGKPGLGVVNWTRGDVDVLQMFALVSGIPLQYTPSLRLYPMNPEDGSYRVFRGVYEALPTVESNVSASATPNGVFASGCLSWGAVDTPSIRKNWL